ncbi:hypothetical protein [Halosolutus gelatinilyticus]|uniref:hypothetical protein n=1 Tax=Halosolutus gelatinilyticus TaxID=2931975 RepID=UPI001FF24239|nr:hypothetical protein [Halosolutus gelatinilyticus]
MYTLLSALVVLQSEANGELPFDEGTIMMISLASFVISLLLGIAVGYWVYKDASKREQSELVWALGTGGLTFLFLPIGIVLLIVYVVVRGDETTSEPVAEQAANEW